MARKRKGKYGTGDPLDYIPFNIDNLPRNKATRRLFEENGLESWRDLFVDWDSVTSGTLQNFRSTIYTTPEEVIKRYASTGILPYVRILYDYITDTYHAYIDY